MLRSAFQKSCKVKLKLKHPEMPSSLLALLHLQWTSPFFCFVSRIVNLSLIFCEDYFTEDLFKALFNVGILVTVSKIIVLCLFTVSFSVKIRSPCLVNCLFFWPRNLWPWEIQPSYFLFLAKTIPWSTKDFTLKLMCPLGQRDYSYLLLCVLCH